MVQLNFKKINPNAILPTQTHVTDAGLDLYTTEEIFIEGEKHHYSKIIKVPTGVAWEPDFNLEYYNSEVSFLGNYNIYMQLADKSSVAANYGLKVMGGVIDQEYRGEIIVIMQTTPYIEVHIKPGQKICQGIVKLIAKVTIGEVEKLGNTKRGEGGFGSTGNF